MRARNIKPGIFLNEILGQADPIFTLLFEGLWCMADKLGRLEDRPLRIRAEIFPYREGLDLNGELTQLERWGFIKRYEVGELKLIQVLNFAKHQTPHHTERPSELPGIADSCNSTVDSPLDHGGNPPDSLIPDSLIPDSCPPKGGPAKAEKPKQRRKSNALEAFSPEASRIVGELRPLWRKEDPDGRPIRVDLSLWGQRLDEILKAHPEVTPDQLIEAGKGYIGAERFRYQAPQFFFGVGREGSEAAWVGYVRLLITKRKSQEVALAS